MVSISPRIIRKEMAHWLAGSYNGFTGWAKAGFHRWLGDNNKHLDE